MPLQYYSYWTFGIINLIVIPLSSEVITICILEGVWPVDVVWDVASVFLIDSGVVDPFCFLAANAKNRQLRKIIMDEWLGVMY